MQYSRRALLGAAGAVVSTGCLTDGSDSGEADDGEDSPPEGCHIENGRWQGRAGAVDERLTVEWSEEPESHPSDGRIVVRSDANTEDACAWAAASVALDRLADELGRWQDGSYPDWILQRVARTPDGIVTGVVVRTKQESTVNGDGSYLICPPPSYDRARTLANLPSEVTVTLTFESDREPYECTHPIQLRQERVQFA